MANVRIKDLSTTASTTASDDFFGVDGATNGTRKLSAYSPTFGGNLTFGTSASVLNGTTGSIGLTATGTNQNITLTPSGTGAVAITGIANGSNALTASTGTVNLAFNLSSGSTGAAIGTTSAHALTFITSNAARAIFAANGNLLVGTTTDTGEKLQVNGTAYVSGNATFAGKISANGSTTWASASSAQLYWNTATGINLAGSGSSYDVSVLNKNGDLALYVPTGTQNVTIAGNLSVSGAGNSVFSGDLYVVGVITTQNGTASTPASASASGNAGTIKWDANYIYVCTATNTWKRVAIATWP